MLRLHPSSARVNCKINKRVALLDNFNFRAVSVVKKRGNPKKPVEYLKQPAFFDTETSYDHKAEENPVGWVYQWAMEFNNEIVVGRSIIEWLLILDSIVEYYELSESKRLVCYVHNLSYDFCYFYQFLIGRFGAPEILAIKAHKILIARFGGLEFRCSYLLSNMSLSLWGKKLNSNVRKMDGAIDYEAQHYPDEELSQEDWDYMANDVLALKENVYRDMLFYNDNVSTIPYTSTGYVRRDTRKACTADKSYRKWFRETRLNAETYLLHIEAFAGGLTHGNRFLGGITLLEGAHKDAKSHYPSMQQLRYMPDGKWLHYYNYSSDGALDPEVFKELLDTQCCLIKIMFRNLKLKRGVTCPCISKHKINNYWDVDFRNDYNKVGTDNGKVINAYGNIMMTVTELDLYWIYQQYDIDGYLVIDLYTSERGRMKEAIRGVINSYFKNKETLPDGPLRDKSKNKLNGIYGMSGTNPIRNEVSLNFDTLEWIEEKRVDLEHIQEELDKYYASRNSFNNYSYGVYTTSWARWTLLDVIQNVVGYENFYYCDTDSVFYKSTPEIEAKFEEYNNRMIELNKQLHLGVKNLKGEMSYYGVFAAEDDFKKFRFLHSKCYALIDENDKLQVTIAGVTKDNKQPKDHPDYITSAQELGDIENLHDGFVFVDCGGTKSKYIEAPVGVAVVEGHTVDYASRCIISTTTKELGGTVEGIEVWEEASDI